MSLVPPEFTEAFQRLCEEHCVTAVYVASAPDPERGYGALLFTICGDDHLVEFVERRMRFTKASR